MRIWKYSKSSKIIVLERSTLFSKSANIQEIKDGGLTLYKLFPIKDKVIMLFNWISNSFTSNFPFISLGFMPHKICVTMITKLRKRDK